MNFSRIELLKLLGAYAVSLIFFMSGSIWYNELTYTDYIASRGFYLRDLIGALLPILVHTFFVKKVWKDK